MLGSSFHQPVYRYLHLFLQVMHQKICVSNVSHLVTCNLLFVVTRSSTPSFGRQSLEEVRHSPFSNHTSISVETDPRTSFFRCSSFHPQESYRFRKGKEGSRSSAIDVYLKRSGLPFPTPSNPLVSPIRIIHLALDTDYRPHMHLLCVRKTTNIVVFEMEAG